MASHKNIKSTLVNLCGKKKKRILKILDYFRPAAGGLPSPAKYREKQGLRADGKKFHGHAPCNSPLHH